MLGEKGRLDFCLRDYEMKVEFLKGHYSRLWTRFNFFLTIELALYGFLGYLLFDPDAKNYEGTLFPIILGLGVSVIWSFVGYQDRALVKMYQRAVREGSERIACIDGLEWYKNMEVGAKTKVNGRFTYCRWLSITTLPFWLGLLTFIAWLAMLFLWCQEMAPFDLS